MITYISGGERSGKSGFAQNLALELTNEPVYLATAKIWDSDFKARIARHQADRDERWTNVEEHIHLSKVLPTQRIVVIDCVTLWLTNLFSKFKSDKNKAFEYATQEFNQLLKYNGHLIFISNEIGMGLHAHEKVSRDFVELQGWTNQLIAKKADEAYFMVSGLPIKIK